MPPFRNPPREGAVDRFLRYVRIDTQSQEDQSTTPSTAKQWNLANLLVSELRELGVEDVRTTEHCMVYATIPATAPIATGIPTIGFIAHVDTSPAVSGADVHPVVHKNYRGGDIVLPKDPSQVITVAQHPLLAVLLRANTTPTAGTTLLGSDDIAGVATIMTMVDVLVRN